MGPSNWCCQRELLAGCPGSYSGKRQCTDPHSLRDQHFLLQNYRSSFGIEKHLLYTSQESNQMTLHWLKYQ